MTRLAITSWPASGLAPPSNAPIVPTTRPLLLAVRVHRRKPPLWVRWSGPPGNFQNLPRLLQKRTG